MGRIQQLITCSNGAEPTVRRRGEGVGVGKQKPLGLPPVDAFASHYPNVARWVQDGWIEIGRDDFSRSFVRVLDIGGLIWEGEARYSTVHEALMAADAAVARWFETHG
jgi:hypothetical protein